MTPGDDGQPLSVRPPPVADRKPRNIADFIARVNAQPGGFRTISEAKLREEIAQENVAGGDLQHKDVDMAEADEDDNDDDHDATRDPQEVRMEMFKNLEYGKSLLSRRTGNRLQVPTQANIYSQYCRKYGTPYSRLPLTPHFKAKPHTSRRYPVARPT